MSEAKSEKLKAPYQRISDIVAKLSEKFAGTQKRLRKDFPYCNSNGEQTGTVRVVYYTSDYDRHDDGPGTAIIIIKVGDTDCKIKHTETGPEVELTVNLTQVADPDLLDALIANVERSTDLILKTIAENDSRKANNIQEDMREKAKKIL